MYISIEVTIVDQNNQMRGGVKMMTPGFWDHWWTVGQHVLVIIHSNDFFSLCQRLFCGKEASKEYLSNSHVIFCLKTWNDNLNFFFLSLCFSVVDRKKFIILERESVIVGRHSTERLYQNVNQINTRDAAMDMLCLMVAASVSIIVISIIPPNMELDLHGRMLDKVKLSENASTLGYRVTLQFI